MPKSEPSIHDTADEFVQDAIQKVHEILEVTKWPHWRLAEEIDAGQSTVSRWTMIPPKSRPNRDKIIAINALHRRLLPDAYINSDEPKFTIDVPEVDESLSEGVRWSIPSHIIPAPDGRDMVALMVPGDSMEPTFRQNDTVFIDRSQRSPSPEGVFAVDLGDGITIKRLKFFPKTDRILVISDNRTAYGEPDEVSREDISIYGRVIGWSQWRA